MISLLLLLAPKVAGGKRRRDADGAAARFFTMMNRCGSERERMSSARNNSIPTSEDFCGEGGGNWRPTRGHKKVSRGRKRASGRIMTAPQRAGRNARRSEKHKTWNQWPCQRPRQLGGDGEVVRGGGHGFPSWLPHFFRSLRHLQTIDALHLCRECRCRRDRQTQIARARRRPRSSRRRSPTAKRRRAATRATKTWSSTMLTSTRPPTAAPRVLRRMARGRRALPRRPNDRRRRPPRGRNATRRTAPSPSPRVRWLPRCRLRSPKDCPLSVTADYLC